MALVDLRLPDIDGVEVLRRIRAAQVGTACVVVTGFADVELTAEAMRLGAFSVLEKPVFADQLVEVVKTARGRPCARLRPELVPHGGRAGPAPAFVAAVRTALASRPRP